MAEMRGPAESIKAKFAALEPLLDERTRRIWAAVEAQALGRGGISRVAEATGMSRCTGWATACRRIARRWKGASMRTGTRNSCTSTGAQSSSRAGANRSCQWTLLNSGVFR